MPASPRVAAIGIGAVVAITLGIPTIAGIIATNAVAVQNAREQLVTDLKSVHRDLRNAGLADDRLPTPQRAPELWASLTVGVTGFRGNYAVFEDDFPLHRLPGNVVALVHDRKERDESVLDVATLEPPGVTLGELFGRSSGVGIAVVFADGEVYVLRDRTPASALRPFVTRNTAVKRNRDDSLRTYQLNR